VPRLEPTHHHLGTWLLKRKVDDILSRQNIAIVTRFGGIGGQQASGTCCTPPETCAPIFAKVSTKSLGLDPFLTCGPHRAGVAGIQGSKILLVCNSTSIRNVGPKY
jgi:hypothetical protein